MIGFIFGFIPGWRVFSTLIGLTLFVLLAVIVYENVFAGPGELTSSEVRVINALMEEIGAEVRDFADEHQLRSVEVHRLSGNETPSGQVTLQVRKRLDRALSDAGVRVVGTGFTTRLRDSVFRERDIDDDKSREELEEQLNKAREEIRKDVANQRLIDFVLYGSVELERFDDDAWVALDLHLQGGEEGMHRRIQASLSSLDDMPASTGGGGIRLGGFGEFMWRLLVFLIVGFFLPVVTGPLAMYAFRMESNAVNFLLLTLLTTAAGLVAWTLTGFGTGGWAIVAVLLALVAAGFWNYRVLDEWERRA